jgi:PAS domain S-box-containing protein
MENKYFKEIIDNSHESIVFLDSDHKVIAINKKFKDFQKTTNLLDLNIGDYYHPLFSNLDNEVKYTNAFNSALNGSTNTIIYSTDDYPIKKWIELKMFPLFLNNQISGVSQYLKDISIEKEADLEVVKMSKILNAILNSIDESILLINKDYKILVFNKLFENTTFENTNIKAELGDDFRNYINEGNIIFLEYCNKALNGENHAEEISYQKSENEIKWYKTKFSSVYSETNELIGVSIISKDITKEKNFELLLTDSEQKLKIMVENNPIAKFIIQNNKIIYSNPVFARIYKLPQTKFFNNISFEELIHPDDIKIFQKALKKNNNTKKTPESVLIRTYNVKGKLVYVEFFVTSVMFNNEPAIVGSVVNITERIQEENRINLAILETQEKERLQIGMELHDNVKQILSGISIYLDVALKKIEDKEAVISLLNKLKNYNNDAVSELRKLSHQLAPLVEDDSSLKDKIDWLILSLNLHDTLSISIAIDDFKFKIKDDIQLHFYRILQELFTNIIKYSKADKVEILIYKLKERIWLKIKDNGIGFDVNVKKQGVGLENIRRRVKILNGELKIVTEIGKGVEVIIKVPYT